MNYLVFGFDDFYPEGGMEDCIHKCNTFEEAIEFIENDKSMRLTYQKNKTWKKQLRYNRCNYQVYNVKTGELIKKEGDES